MNRTAFSMNRLFGTNGIRWLTGDREPDFAVRLGNAAGMFFGSGKIIAIGMDTRTTSPMLESAVEAGAMTAGCNLVFLGVVPTPVVQFAVREMKLDGGLMITASHNPPEFNGIKFFSSDGTEFSRAQEIACEDIMADGKIRQEEWNRVGNRSQENNIQGTYRASILKKMQNRGKKLLAIVDCANGTAIDYTPAILKSAGCQVQTLNAHADGHFPGRMPEPVAENVGHLISAVKTQGADIGIAHDGDADRATFVDDKGNYVTGDRSLAVFARDAIKRAGKGVVVIPINTSKVVQDVVESGGGKVEYTAIGSPLIARRMMENGAILGGEGNGGAIFPEHQYCRDGMMAAARLTDIISGDGPLSGILAELPKYSIKSGKIRIDPRLKDRIMEEVKKQADGTVVELDGIKSVHGEHWSLVRASGTEPLIRVTVETDNDAKCVKLLDEKMSQVKEIISRLS